MLCLGQQIFFGNSLCRIKEEINERGQNRGRSAIEGVMAGNWLGFQISEQIKLIWHLPRTNFLWLKNLHQFAVTK